MAGIPAGFDVDDPTCPKCGGAMWDNRKKKASGDYKATRSDFSCKDKDGCGHGVWIEGKSAKPAASAAAAGVASSAAKPNLSPADRKAGRDKVFADYLGLMSLVAERMAVIAKQREIPLEMANVQAATWSVYGLMKDKGYLSAPVKAAVAPVAPPPPRKPAPKPAAEFEEFPGALEAEDDLPF